LYQVEYALEVVKRGFTCIGIRYRSGVVLGVERRKITPLAKETEKIVEVDDHIGLAFAGLSSDARVLIDRARIYAQLNKLYYDEPIDVEVLTRKICDIKQVHTQYGGTRPFGVSFIIAGVDYDGPKLFMTEPSGAYAEYYAVAIGSGAHAVTEFFEKNYKEGMAKDEALLLALKALSLVIEGKLDKTKVELAVVDTEDKKFKKISQDQIEELLRKLEESG